MTKPARKRVFEKMTSFAYPLQLNVCGLPAATACPFS